MQPGVESVALKGCIEGIGDDFPPFRQIKIAVCRVDPDRWGFVVADCAFVIQ